MQLRNTDNCYLALDRDRPHVALKHRQLLMLGPGQRQTTCSLETQTTVNVWTWTEANHMLYLRNTNNSLDLDRGKPHVVPQKHRQQLIFGPGWRQTTSCPCSLETQTPFWTWPKVNHMLQFRNTDKILDLNRGKPHDMSFETQTTAWTLTGANHMLYLRNTDNI